MLSNDLTRSLFDGDDDEERADEAAAAGGPAAAAPAADSPADTLALLRQWVAAGWLRRLDGALAALLAELDPEAPPALLLCAAALAHLEGHGHTGLDLRELMTQPSRLLAWPTEGLAAWDAAWDGAWQAHGAEASLAALQQQLTRSATVRATEAAPDTGQPLVLEGEMLYLRRYWHHERAVAQAVRQRCGDEPAQALEPGALAQARAWLDRLFPPREGVDWQKAACALALRGRLTVITGGPGTGKTYTAARLLALLLAQAPDPTQLRVALAAPTGKAAARLKQAIDSALGQLEAGLDGLLDLRGLTERIGAARTLHALLGARPDRRAFRHDARHPLELDVLIVDEASMVHLEMMAAVLAALPPGARLVLLGDKDQLASVEAGAVLGDLCRDAVAGRYDAATRAHLAASAGVHLPAEYADNAGPRLAQHTVMLRESRRFGGAIGQLAQAVNAGDRAAVQALLATCAQAEDPAIRALQGGQPEALLSLACAGRDGAPGGYGAYVALLKERPAPGEGEPALRAHEDWVRRVLVAFDRFRLLCAVRDGAWGTEALNRAVPQALARLGLRPQGEWYVGRPVMVTRNDPALGVFNGDIGMVLPGARSEALRAWFLDGQTLRSVGVGRLAHVETAFAMTVHKSQGSEFWHTVLVLPEQAGLLLSRELVYTGITRAREAFTLVTARAGALEEAVQQPTRRVSGLLRMLDPGAARPGDSPP
jgi:exodeoxyribonuclease V alpha subunit